MNVFPPALAVAALLCVTPIMRAETVDSVVARVQDEIITSFSVYEECERQERALRTKLAGKELEKALSMLRNHTAVRMIEQELIFAEFEALGGELPDILVQRRVDRYVKAQADGNRAKFEAMVEEREMTMAEFEAKISRALAIELMVREKVRRNIDIPPTRIRAYYDEHRDEFVRDEEVRFQAIVIRNDGKYKGKQEETADKVLAELAAGKPFADVARTWSEGVYAEEGGDRGWAKTTNSEGKPTYEGPLREALASLKPGQYTKKPLKIGASTYFVRLVDRRGGTAPALDAELQEKIREMLSMEEERTRYRAFVNELRRKYFVKVFDRELTAFWDSL